MSRLIDTTLTRSVLEFATQAHVGDLRLPGTPYIIHPYAVASLVTLHYETFGEQYLDGYLTALLHDVLEDTDKTCDDIVQVTGSTLVADAVQALTKDESVGDVYEQLSDSLRRAQEVGDWVVWIKAFDKVDNLNFALCPPTRSDQEFEQWFTENEILIGAVEETQGGETILSLLKDADKRYKLFAGVGLS